MKSTLVLQIALPIPVYQNFEYLAPNNSALSSIEIGARARVPFGKRKLIGIVVGKSAQTTVPLSKLKYANEILDSQAVFERTLLELLFWAANYYQQPLGEVLSSALPKELRQGKYITPPTKIIYQLCSDEISHRALHRAPKQRFILELLQSHPEGLDVNAIRQHTPNWRPAVHALVNKQLVKKIARSPAPTINEPGTTVADIPLNQEQQHAYAQIHQTLNEFNTFLLAGVTGSGKTEVYLALAKDIITRNRQVLILVPEIGLTSQLVRRIETRLGARVASVHSNLNDAERAQSWLAAKNGTVQIIVGTRSAVFLSFKDLGLIVVDEEHDLSFKQQNGFLYHARDIAIYRAKQLSIPVILGSATPCFESLHNVDTGRYQKLVLSQRAQQTKIPQVKLIDLRATTVSNGLSNELIEAIKTEIDNNHQVLLFLNRRGYAPTIFCQDCSWVAECLRCDARMTFYKKQQIIKCHHCLKEKKAPQTCPRCKSQNLLWLGEGTQRIENKLRELYPEVAITRIDRDSTRKKNILQNKLHDIHNGSYQIIIGTQMLSKGHDFPGVSLVGILNVDQGLFSTDFRATERLAQLIVQVAGRAGRSTNRGKVLLQTYQPQHPLLNCLLAHGYAAFSKEALKIRKSCALPPYTFMLLIRARAHKQNLTQRFLRDIKHAVLEKSPSKSKILGPIPALLERKAGLYQSQLVIISPNRQGLQQYLHHWTLAILQRPLAKRVRWNIEVDPLEMG